MKILSAVTVAAALALALSAVEGLVVVGLGAQEAAKYGADPNYQAPRLADGHPDLQGVLGNNSVTPMTRPTQWKDKERLTDAELKELKAIVQKFTDQGGDAIFQSVVQMALDAKEKGKFDQTSYDPTTGNYNQFWMADREWDNRTSLITDPPDGQFPPLTPEAQARRAPVPITTATSRSSSRPTRRCCCRR